MLFQSPTLRWCLRVRKPNSIRAKTVGVRFSTHIDRARTSTAASQSSIVVLRVPLSSNVRSLSHKSHIHIFVTIPFIATAREDIYIPRSSTVAR